MTPQFEELEAMLRRNIGLPADAPLPEIRQSDIDTAEMINAFWDAWKADKGAFWAPIRAHVWKRFCDDLYAWDILEVDE